MGVSNLDKMARGIRTLHGSGSDSQFVRSGGNVIGIGDDVDSLDAPRGFQIGALIAIGKLEVVLHVGIGASIAALEREGGVIAVNKPELGCIGSSFEKFSILIESQVVLEVIDFEFLTDLRERFLVFGKKGNLVDFGFPEQVAFLRFLLLCHNLATLRIDCIFGLQPEGLRYLTCCRLTFEPFTDCDLTQVQVLLDLIAGDELRSSHGIK